MTKLKNKKRSGGFGGRQPPEFGAATTASRAAGARGGPSFQSCKFFFVFFLCLPLRPWIESLFLELFIETSWLLGILGILGFSISLLPNNDKYRRHPNQSRIREDGCGEETFESCGSDPALSSGLQTVHTSETGFKNSPTTAEGLDFWGHLC